MTVAVGGVGVGGVTVSVTKAVGVIVCAGAATTSAVGVTAGVTVRGGVTVTTSAGGVTTGVPVTGSVAVTAGVVTGVAIRVVGVMAAVSVATGAATVKRSGAVVVTTTPCSSRCWTMIS